MGFWRSVFKCVQSVSWNKPLDQASLIIITMEKNFYGGLYLAFTSRFSKIATNAVNLNSPTLNSIFATKLKLELTEIQVLGPRVKAKIRKTGDT